MMDDKFLYQFREVPDREFVEGLYHKITKKKGMTFMNRILPRRRLAYVYAAFLIAVVAIFSVSPVARAAANLLMQKIGQILRPLKKSVLGGNSTSKM